MQRKRLIPATTMKPIAQARKVPAAII